MRTLTIVTTLLLGLFTPASAVRSTETIVDVQLVLAVDSSSSVSMDEFYLQLEGYAAAFRHPDLLQAIRKGPHGAIAVALVEWSGARQHVVNFPWRRLAESNDLEALAAELAVAPRLIIGGETAIGDAIDFATDLFDTSEFRAARRVIDVSGDGVSNRGRAVHAARTDAMARGVVINGLAILNEDEEIEGFYRTFVAGGPGSFVLTALDYEDFAGVILRKLLLEIQLVADAGR